MTKTSNNQGNTFDLKTKQKNDIKNNTTGHKNLWNGMQKKPTKSYFCRLANFFDKYSTDKESNCQLQLCSYITKSIFDLTKNMSGPMRSN